MVSLELSELKQDGNELWWTLTVPGPIGSPYEGKYYTVRINYESTYPFRSPRIRFETPIFHPNFTSNGHSSNLIDEPWSPSCTISTLYERIQWLLTHPNAVIPYNSQAAELLRNDPIAFKKVAAHAKLQNGHWQLNFTDRDL